MIFEFPLDEDMIHDIYAMHKAGKKNEARGYDVAGYFLLVMSRLVKAARGTTGERQGEYYVKRAKKFIEDNYSEPLSVNDIAQNLRLDRTYLYRLFMKHEGISPSEYLLSVRLKAAEKMLENDQLPIREAALNAGFCNISYFYRRFSERYGVSPKKHIETKSGSK